MSQLVGALAADPGLGEVRACYLDFDDPTPDAALRQLAAEGFRRIRLVPLLFAPGYHVTVDIPAALAVAGEELEVSVAPALLESGPRGRQLLLDALVQRLGEAADLDRTDGVVLASAGSSAAAARAAVEGLAVALGDRLGCRAVAAYASASAPTVSEALVSLRTGGSRHPAVARLFASPGRLPDVVAGAADGVPVAEPLGVATAFVRLLRDVGSAP